MNDINHLVEMLATEASPVRPAPSPLILSLKLMGTATVYLALSLAVSGLRPDLMEKLHTFWFAAEIALLILIFASTSISVALLGFPDLHQNPGATYAPAAVFIVFLAVMFFAWNADTPPAPLPMHSIECTLGITLVSILPAIWTFYAIRQYASTHQQLAGSIALLSSFSVGALWLRLHELNDSVIHLIQWHYLPMLGIGILGIGLGKVLLRW
jgi:hypothetical protein